MKQLFQSIIVVFVLAILIVAQTNDWRTMDRVNIENKLSPTALREGLNQITRTSSGDEVNLYVHVKNRQIIRWQAKDRNGRKLVITHHEITRTNDDKISSKTDVLKCVESKRVCYVIG